MLFGSSGSLVGVVTEPDAPDASLPAFLFLNAGVTHHVGPNRLYVQLARALAEDGFTSLRFDYSGLGDSGVRPDELPAWKSVGLETSEAMELLTSTRGIERFIPIGICSGAINAYLTAREDPRTVGAVLINGQGHLHGTDPELSAQLRARTLSRHYRRIALFSSYRAKNWRKAFGGQLSVGRILQMMVGVPMGVLRGLFGQRAAPADAPDPVADLRAIGARGTRLFHLYCEGDEGLDYFHVVLGGKLKDVASTETARFEIIFGANHVFSLLWTQERCVDMVCDWARSLPTAAAAGDSER